MSDNKREQERNELYRTIEHPAISHKVPGI